MAVTIDSFDYTMYQRLPPMTLEHALALGSALLERVPGNAPLHVRRTAERLEGIVAEGREALTIRLREGAPAYTAHEVAVDTAVDALWATLRSRLEGWLVFEQPAFDASMGPSRRDRAAKSLTDARRNAVRARRLLDRIYGPRGLTFIQTSYFEQCEAMAALLRLIDEDGLTEDLLELAGEAWWTALHHMQGRYAAMVQKRMGRPQATSRDLAQLRLRLHRCILRYTAALLTMIDEDEPVSLDVVLDALRPFTLVRKRRKRTRPAEGDARDDLAEDDPQEDVIEDPDDLEAIEAIAGEPATSRSDA